MLEAFVIITAASAVSIAATVQIYSEYREHARAVSRVTARRRNAGHQ